MNQACGAAPRAQRDAGTVLAVRVDARGERLLAVDEDLHDAPVDEDVEVERLAVFEQDIRVLGEAAEHVRAGRGARRVERDGAGEAHRRMVVPTEVVPAIASPRHVDDARHLLGVRRAEHAELDRGGFTRVDRSPDLEHISLGPVEEDVFVRRQLAVRDRAMVAAKRGDVAGRLRAQPVAMRSAGEAESARERHDLVPSARRPRDGGVHVEQRDHRSVLARRRRGRVDAARRHRSEVEPPAVGDDEAVRFAVVVAEQVAAAAHVAEVQEDVVIADRPEVRAGEVVAHERDRVVDDEGVDILPAEQVGRSMEKRVRALLPARSGWQRAAGKRVVDLALLPDARIEDRVGEVRVVGAGHRDDRPVAELLPVQKQGIARDGDHRARLRAVVDRDDAVVLDERAPGEATVLRARVDRVGEVAPAHEVVADRVAPVLSRVLGRVGLVEEMPATLPAAEAVRIVERALRADEVERRAEAVVRVGAAARREPPDEGVLRQLAFLPGELPREFEARDARRRVGWIPAGTRRADFVRLVVHGRS